MFLEIQRSWFGAWYQPKLNRSQLGDGSSQHANISPTSLVWKWAFFLLMGQFSPFISSFTLLFGLWSIMALVDLSFPAVLLLIEVTACRTNFINWWCWTLLLRERLLQYVFIWHFTKQSLSVWAKLFNLIFLGQISKYPARESWFRRWCRWRIFGRSYRNWRVSRWQRVLSHGSCVQDLQEGGHQTLKTWLGWFRFWPI